jgi:tetratricopeptide (TPR) repeat protein
LGGVFDFGVEVLQRRPSVALAAFYWAGRLDPERPDPPFWEWIAFHSTDIGRFQRYLENDKDVLKEPDVRHADSLRYRALLRNPLIPQGGIAAVYDKLPGGWGFDDLSRGWIAYARNDFAKAAELFDKVIKADPEDGRWLRFHRAATLVMASQFAAAQRELELLDESFTRDEKKRTVRIYESHELLDYARGLIALSRNDVAEGRRQFEKALVENLAFAPAHLQLGALALRQRDTATAIQELGLAAELDSSDAPTRLQYGRALHWAHRSREAIVHLRAATSLEPYYTDAYEALGEALEAMGQTADAIVAYQSAQINASAKSASGVKANGRLRALKAGSP